jgi:LITAF-like zinc ribbon domain
MGQHQGMYTIGSTLHSNVHPMDKFNLHKLNTFNQLCPVIHCIHIEPTIAIVDAVIVDPDPNETSDIEQGNNNNNWNTPSGNSNNYHKQHRYTAEPSETCNNSNSDTDIVVLRRHQPPAPRIVYGHLGRYECGMQCPFCETTMVTRTKTSCDGITWLFVLILFILFWPLCWLPLCMPKCQRVHHYCTHCQRKVGVTEPCS